MTRPSDVKIRIATAGGRPIKPGPTVQIDWDIVSDNTIGLHQTDDLIQAGASKIYADALATAEANGQTNKARRLRKDLNHATETRLGLRASFCPSCLNFLHNCLCATQSQIDRQRGASIDLIDRIQSQIAYDNLFTEADRKNAKKEAKKALRKAKKNGN